MSKAKYDSTVARMAGNIAGGLVRLNIYREEVVAMRAVAMARAIIEEVKRTEPKDESITEA